MRENSAYACASLSPNVVGSAWMPCERPDRRRHLVLDRAALDRGEQRVEVGEEDVARANELHVEASIEHVGRRHALVDETRIGPDDLGEVGEERDDVVLGLALDRVDALDVECCGPALRPDGLRGLLGDQAKLGHRIRRVRFDLEPDAELCLRRPDGGHLGPGIARDHAEKAPCESALSERPSGFKRPDYAASPRASMAASRIAAMLAR